MKNLLGITGAFAAFGLVCGAAFAENPIVKDLPISGTVKSIAIFPTAPRADDSSNASLTDGAIRITELAGEDLHPQHAGIQVTYPGVTTNYSAKIGLYSEKNGLRTSATPASGFTNRVNYGVDLVISSIPNVSLQLTTGGTDASKSSLLQTPLDSFTGDLTIDVHTLPNETEKLVEGEYTDKLTLKIGSEL